MLPVFRKATHAANRVGKKAISFHFDIHIEQVGGLPASAGTLQVLIHRGAKNVQTRVATSKNGIATFNQNLTMLSTLYRSADTQTFDEKDYKLSVYESSQRKKIGKVHVNFAVFARPEGHREELVLKLESKLPRSKPFIKVVITSRMRKELDTIPSDAISDISFATGAMSEALVSEGTSRTRESLEEGEQDLISDEEISPRSTGSAPAPPVIRIDLAEQLPPPSKQSHSPRHGSPDHRDKETEIQSLITQVSSLKSVKRNLEGENRELLKRVQQLQEDLVDMRHECGEVRAARDQLKSQLDSIMSSTIQNRSDHDRKPPPPEPKRHTPSDPPALRVLLENRDGDIAAFLSQPAVDLILEQIEVQAVVRERLGNELRILEEEVGLLRGKSGRGKGVAKKPDNVLLARIHSLEEQLHQARADSSELRQIVAELTRSFRTVISALGGSEEQGNATVDRALCTTITQLGEHIGNVLAEKAEMAMVLTEQKEEEEAAKAREQDESYLRQRIKRLELELATARQEKAMQRERMSGLEEKNIKYRLAISTLGNRVTELELQSGSQHS